MKSVKNKLREDIGNRENLRNLFSEKFPMLLTEVYDAMFEKKNDS